MTAVIETAPAGNEQPVQRRPAKHRPVKWRGLLLHALLAIAGLLCLFPFFWTLVMATNTTADIYRFPPKFTFGSQFDDNVREVLANVAFFQSMGNTAIVAVSTTLLVLFFDSLAAFTFAKFRFPGRNALFVILLATMLLPAQLGAVPQFQTMAAFGWVGSLKALVIPAAANAFGIFWLRQYFQNSIHDELVEAATLDGCGFLGVYRHVALPSARPALAFLGIFTFVASWNDYFWPLIVLTNPDHLTLQVALSSLNRSHGVDYSMVMTGALMAMVPLIVVFIIFARQFIKGATEGAIRG
ncbi:cellobiose transport system permease protein [Kribbella orskensis]|uniref:Cellobiose transport system permease protein n=1 Tax=Kribbella orskensis TaxID=2512216 RepID=A0ABY2BFV2_9ACTN|nr:cellobiose transport system permease protein [Kribbella sp. VKM Ac-2500]TCO18891.1 cellobiose transport system permease protein [Kribbella orskensis]